MRLLAQLVTVAALLNARQAPAQHTARFEVSPVAGAAIFLRELPSHFRLRDPGGELVEFAGVGVNPGITLGGYLSIWLSRQFALEASAAFVPTALQGAGTDVSVDVQTYMLGAASG